MQIRSSPALGWEEDDGILFALQWSDVVGFFPIIIRHVIFPIYLHSFHLHPRRLSPQIARAHGRGIGIGV